MATKFYYLYPFTFCCLLDFPLEMVDMSGMKLALGQSILLKC